MTVGNLTGALVSTGAQTTARTINFYDWPASTNYASSSAATAAANCAFAAGTIRAVSTNALTCYDSADTWSVGSNDRFDLLSSGDWATGNSPLAWSATETIE
jgi:hypothetical protein